MFTQTYARMKNLHGPFTTLASALLVCGLGACSKDDQHDSSAHTAHADVTNDKPADAGTDAEKGDEPVYAVATSVWQDESGNAYVALLGDLAAGDIELGNTREFSDGSSIGSIGGKLFVSDGETAEFKRFNITEDLALEEETKLSFAGYDVAYPALYSSLFVSPTQAYLAYQQDARLRWNPSTMEIEGPTASFGAAPLRDKLVLYPSTYYRGSVVDGDRIITGLYWTDTDWYQYPQNSQFAIASASDDDASTLIDMPCPMLDIISKDEQGTVYGTNWLHSAQAPALGGKGPKNCIAWLERGQTEVAQENVLQYADLTGGHEGAAFRYLKDGRGVMAVFFEDEVTPKELDDPATAFYTNHWQLWSVDVKARTAARIDGLADFNGAFYVYVVDGRTILLLPDGVEFDHTAAWEYFDDGHVEKLFTIPGWADQLVRIR